MDEIEQKIREFLGQHVPAHALEQNLDLFQGGFVNSLFAVQLVLFVEKEFQVRLGRDDLKLENFRNSQTLAELVHQAR